jgi:hypothetical protein
MTPRLRSTSAILVAFAIPLGVYVASLRGDVSFWDTGDLQTVPYILGIPYPTGFPGFVLLGWLWSHAIPFGIVAWRMNLLTAVASAAGAAALVAFLIVAGVGDLIALASALVFAFTNLVWNHATYVDVHPVSFAAMAWALVFALCWCRDGRVRDAAFALTGATLALACDNTTVLLLPGLLLLALIRRPPPLAAVRGLGIAVLVLAAVYAYLPLRSAQLTAQRVDPTLALGIAPGRPFWDDGHPSTLDGFEHVVGGVRFSPGRAAFAMFGPTAFHRLLSDFAPRVANDLTEPALWLALFGAGVWWWRSPVVLGSVLLFGLVPLLFIFAYNSESDTGRYFLAAYFALAAMAGYGAQALTALPAASRMAAASVGAIVVVNALGMDERQMASLFTQPHDVGASAWIDRIRILTPPDAIVVAPWLYATPLGYGAYVEHRLGARIIVTADPQEYLAKYRGWLRTRPVVVVSDDDETFAGFGQKQIDTGSPHLYALR